MRKIPKWLMIAVAVVMVCAGLKLWYNQLCSGNIDISDSAPDKKMLLHIIDHVDELAARTELFSVEVNDRNQTTITYVGNPNFRWSYIAYNSDAYTDISESAETLLYSGTYQRYVHSDFWDLVTPWSEINSTFTIFSVPVSFAFVLDAGIVPDTSDAPLREMMDAIVGIIGRP